MLRICQKPVEDFFSNFVFFSECPNFNDQKYQRLSSSKLDFDETKAFWRPLIWKLKLRSFK